MGFLARVSSVATPARVRAQVGDPFDDRYYIPSLWASSLSAAGVSVTPELAMTLSAYFSGVTMISSDLATLPLQTFKRRDDGGKDLVRPIFGNGIDIGGIGGLAYKLRWQPNQIQTATEFLLSMWAQFLMRGWAYAEIVPGPSGAIEQLLPRHPDRVQRARLPNGKLRYTLTGGPDGPRTLTQDQMFVVRDLSFDMGLTVVSRTEFGADAIGSALATQRAAAKFFKSGMTASMLATYTGDMEDEDEKALHQSISRFGAGVENSFGLMLVPDDVKISNLSINPEKAMMMESQEWGVREVARLLWLPVSKLGLKDGGGYGAQIQDALNYVISTLRPRAVTFEQAIQRDLIIAKDTYLSEFLLAALMRGDFSQQATYLTELIRSRVIRPSEARTILNMNPDADLDRLSEGDFRPGTSGGAAVPNGGQKALGDGSGFAAMTRASLKATLVVHDNAVRCLRRERAAVERIATKNASDPDGWKTGLQEFYAEHAGFVAQTMRLPMSIARGYAGRHGSELVEHGVGWIADAWQQSYEADELTALALCPEAQEAA